MSESSNDVRTVTSIPNIKIGVQDVYRSATSVLPLASILSKSTSIVTDSIAPFIPLIADISIIVQEIVNLYQVAEHNKRICGALLSRATAAETAVRDLQIRRLENESLFRSKEYYKNFQKLLVTIGNIKRFIKEVSQIKGLRRFLMANSIEQGFKDITEEFDGLMRVLNFSMAVQNSVQMEEDRKVLEHDVAEMNKYLDEIEGGIADQVSGINAKLDDITQWNIAWQNKLLSNNEEILTAATIPISEIHDPSDPVKRGAKVYKKIRKGEEVAIKERVSALEEKEHLNDILSQVTILKKLKESQYIVRFYGFVKDNDVMYMVMEWCENGNLQEFYKRSLTWHQKSQIAVDISRGLTFLHTVSILHHDIRSENILITQHQQAKIANFSLSRHVTDQTKNVGPTMNTIRWMAPEKLRDHVDNPYTVKCEIYSNSFGMLLWEIAEEKLPFQEYNDIIQIYNLVVKQRIRPTFSLGVPLEWSRIAHQAMQDNPNARPLLKDIFMTLNGIHQIYQPKKSPSQSPTIPPTVDDLPDDDDLSIDMTDFEICTMSVREAIAEHKKKDGDKLKAWKAFSQHAEFGDMLARYWKGYYLYYDLCPIEDPSDQNSRKERLRQAVEFFKEAAGTGLAGLHFAVDAQLRYGHCLWSGEGVKKDIKESIKYFTWAAENGNYTALYNIGNIYYNGIGAPKDEEKGIRYLRLAALSGQPKALAMCKAKGITL
ncbi:17216_t:CDS:2, partial [Acaulospora morrowiae]